MDVGIRELKKRLSELVDRAARGEVIRVTDRGEPRAVLGPLPGRANLDEGVHEGWIRPGSATAPRRVRRLAVRIRTEAALGEDRDS